MVYVADCYFFFPFFTSLKLSFPSWSSSTSLIIALRLKWVCGAANLSMVTYISQKIKNMIFRVCWLHLFQTAKSIIPWALPDPGIHPRRHRTCHTSQTSSLASSIFFLHFFFFFKEEIKDLCQLWKYFDSNKRMLTFWKPFHIPWSACGWTLRIRCRCWHRSCGRYWLPAGLAPALRFGLSVASAWQSIRYQPACLLFSNILCSSKLTLLYLISLRTKGK